MTYLEPENLIRAKKLANEGKFEEVFHILRNFEKGGKKSYYELVSWHLLKCNILSQQYSYKELNELAEQTYKESVGLGKSLLSIDALYYWALALILSGNLEEAEKIITQGEELFKILPKEQKKDYKQREAHLMLLKGRFFFRNNPNLALEYLEQCQALLEEFGDKYDVAISLLIIARIFMIYKGELDHAFDYIEHALTIGKESNTKFIIAWSLFEKALFYSFKGELDRNITFYEQSLTLFKELNNKWFIPAIFNNLGETYRLKGDVERALGFSEQSVAGFMDLGISSFIINAYDYLIQTLIEKGDLGKAQVNLDQLEQMIDEINNEKVKEELNLMYLLDKAILLKKSSRVRNRGIAEELLKQVLKEDTRYEGKVRALPHLCELLLTELQTTGDIEILNEINEYITQLFNITEKTHSYWVLGDTYLLQAKLALVALNLKKARRLLSKGQQIAEEYGLKLLAMKISNEHDKLLKKLDLWENLKEKEVTLAERLELSRLNEQLGVMVQKRLIDVPELLDEDPMLLLVVSEGGRPIFSQSFVEDQVFEDHLFGGFFTAINSFINEKFSEGLDRASFGEHTLLMHSISPFLMCYVYKGQSYSAQQRIKYFIDELQDDKDTWQTFKEFYRLNKEIQIKDIPSLEPLITRIFIEKSIPLII